MDTFFILVKDRIIFNVKDIWINYTVWQAKGYSNDFRRKTKKDFNLLKNFKLFFSSMKGYSHLHLKSMSDSSEKLQFFTFPFC